MTNVKNYTDKQLIDKMKSLSSFKYVPQGIHLIAIRSNEDAPNTFDDKLYIFNKEQGIGVMSCTTNSGTYGLKNFFKWNSKGTAVIKFDEIYYDAFMKSDGKKVRHHNGKVQCLRLVKEILYYRDNNKDNKIDEKGIVYKENASTNIHPNSYTYKSGILSWLIGGWSTGCIVVNDLSKYWNLLIPSFKYEKTITLTCLKEF